MVIPTIELVQGERSMLFASILHRYRNENNRHQAETANGLRDRGHELTLVGPFEGNGSEGAIHIHPGSRSLMAASDPRRDGDSAVW